MSEQQFADQPAERESLVGSGKRRREDDALLTGRARYTDDVTEPGMVYLAFTRSEHGHARIKGVDTAPATALDGVLGAFTWADLESSGTPGRLPIASSALDCDVPGHPLLARNRVRYQGQPIAAVVATDRYRAADAARAVDVTYDSIEAAVDVDAATADDAPTIFDGAPGNVATVTELGTKEATEDAFEQADHVIELDLLNNRLIPTALEPRAAVARYDAGRDQLTVEMTSQSPHGHRTKLSHSLGIPEGNIRVIAPDVGGGFGHKGHHHPGEAMASWCAMQLDRPVKWTATRSENYLEGAHGRDHVTTAALALDEDGTFRGLKAETKAAVGGYGLGSGPAMPGFYGRLLSSQYRIPAIHCETTAVFTNTAPIHSYRGAGRPEAIYVTERLVDAAARELGSDPATIRRRNLIESFPYETPVGAEYDSGDYEPALDLALDTVDYEQLAKGDRDEDGRLLGVGIACYVESTGGGYESGVVRVHPDGSVTVLAGSHSHGQGHQTTYAQIVADALELPYDDVDVVEGDTSQIPTGTGTFGSRSTITAGNAVAECAESVLAKATRLAAHELDVDQNRVEYSDGTFRDIDSDDTVSFEDVAETAYGWSLPDGLSPGLEATTFYEQEATAYSFGTHAAVVAIHPDTGEVELTRYVAVDDCGEQINPTIVEGQVHGGVAQGIGQAMTELTKYDEDGKLLTNTMQRYGVPRASHIPDFETESTVTPCPGNDLGVKGIGEAGTIAAPPAVVNAVVDALSPLGITHVDMPVTDEAVWRAIQEAR